MFVKVCGLKTVDDVRVAAEAGADAVGFVLSAQSVRAVSLEQATELAAATPAHVRSVLVVNDLPIERAIEAAIASGVGVLQLHGPGYARDDFARAHEAGVRTWRATSPAHTDELTAGAWGEDVLLLDSVTPGSGQPWSLDELPHHPEGRWLLAGGLRVDTVPGAIEAFRPWGVDVSSGVEGVRGTKSHELIRRFVAAARASD